MTRLHRAIAAVLGAVAYVLLVPPTLVILWVEWHEARARRGSRLRPTLQRMTTGRSRVVMSRRSL